MPVLKKEISLEDGTTVWVRQASGREKLRIETLQAKAIRKCRDFGNPADWTEEQNEKFMDILDELGANLEHQMNEWVPGCILDDTDVDTLTSGELRQILMFVRGDDPEGAIPLGSSPE